MRSVIAIVMLLVVGGLGLWLQDVAQVVLATGGSNVTNGFFSMDAQKAYHLGLYSGMVSGSSITLIGIVLAIRGRDYAQRG